MEEFAAADPVARVGEFGSGPVVPSARRRMVLRSTPVSRAISRWLVPVASSVATVVRLFGFKTFTLHAPLRWLKGKGYVLPAGLLSGDRLPTAALNSQEVGDFDPARGGGFCPANGGPNEAIKLLETGAVVELSLDHDLGDDERGTGYDVVLWIEEAVALRDFKPPKIAVHSANSSAREKMVAGIRAIERIVANRQN